MSSSGISTKSVRNLEKPKPLRLSAGGTRSIRPVSVSSPTEPVMPHHASMPHPHRLSTGPSSVLELMTLLDKVSTQLSNAHFDHNLTNNIDLLYSQMKLFGSQIESSYQTEVDNAFVTLRKGTESDKLDESSRLKLLHLVELRSAGWKSLHTDYYAQSLSKASEIELSSSVSSHSVDSLLSPLTPPPNVLPILSPGELVKASGKYPKPTKIPGKNYCKDEVVIRNADSGKVMGIKGRRVHMIEELSETIISFQRVHPGARERNVQITGPNPDNIVHATQLIDETIRKNQSPVRELGLQDSTLLDSNSSCNSSQSDDSGLKLQQPDESLDFPHQFRHFVSFGNGRYVSIVGNDYSLVNNVVVLVANNKHLVSDSPPPPLLNSGSLISPPLDLDEEPLSYSSPLHPSIAAGGGRGMGDFTPISPLGASLPSYPPSPYSYLLDTTTSTTTTHSNSYTQHSTAQSQSSSSTLVQQATGLSAALSEDTNNNNNGVGRATTPGGESKTKLSRSKSDVSSSSSLRTSKLTRTYSRDFLIMCSKSPLSQQKPPELIYIELNYSEITKPDDGKYFDAVEYLTQCELDKHKPRRLASYSGTDDCSDEYELSSTSTPNTSSSKLFS
uniref:K Homology domain-containing protein n=2 Tax=Cacopsylla melanoneura TaxID=428564 RepID=A0A8D9EIX8_9HEMI